MSVSPESPTSTSDEKLNSTSESPADLSENLDEASDLQLALGALGGLRATTANDESERSHRRYDDRNHRLHEARMAEKFGLEDKAEDSDGEGMGHQVWIRSPVHHHHSPEKTPTPDAASSPDKANSLATGIMAALLSLGSAGAGIAITRYLTPDNPSQLVDTNTIYEVEKWTPGQDDPVP